MVKASPHRYQKFSTYLYACYGVAMQNIPWRIYCVPVTWLRSHFLRISCFVFLFLSGAPKIWQDLCLNTASQVFYRLFSSQHKLCGSWISYCFKSWLYKHFSPPPCRPDLISDPSGSSWQAQMVAHSCANRKLSTDYSDVCLCLTVMPPTLPWERAGK